MADEGLLGTPRDPSSTRNYDFRGEKILAFKSPSLETFLWRKIGDGRKSS